MSKHMSKGELVNKYLEGRMAHRQFVEGLVVLGVSSSAAGAYANALLSRPAEDEFTRNADGYFVRQAFDPNGKWVQ
jgi:hypothetical protein